MPHLCHILGNIQQYPVRFERRPMKYKFGVHNYGDIPNTINPADGDPVDVFAPGIAPLPINTLFKVQKLLGVYVLKNGNHKLCVKLAGYPIRDVCATRVEIQRYCRKYTQTTGVAGVWLSYDPEYDNVFS